MLPEYAYKSAEEMSERTGLTLAEATAILRQWAWDPNSLAKETEAQEEEKE